MARYLLWLTVPGILRSEGDDPLFNEALPCPAPPEPREIAAPAPIQIPECVLEEEPAEVY